MASLSMKDLLRFVHLAGTERSTAKVFTELSRFIGETLVAHRVTVYVVEEGRFVPFVSEYTSGETNHPQFTAWRGSNAFESSALAARLATDEEVLLIGDPADVLPQELINTYGIKSLLAAPLSIDSILMGALVVEGEYEDLQGRLTEIRELAGIVALALENARAFERERERTEESEALLEVATVLTESTEVSTVLAAVARNSARVAGFERCSILLIEGDGPLKPVMSQFADGHTDVELWERFRSIQADLPAARLVVESGEPAAYTEPNKVPELIPPEWLTPFKMKSVLFVPLAAWGEGFGVLLLDHRERRPIAPQQVRIAHAVAAQGAAAIRISRLLQREGDSRREAETALRALRVRESQQVAVAALSHSAMTAFDLTALMDEAVQVLTTTLNLEYGKVLELLPGGDQFLLKAGVGWNEGLVGKATVEAGYDSQAGFTMSTAHPVIVEDIATDRRFTAPRLLTDHGVVSGISVVIEGREHPYGVLGVHTSQRRTLTSVDINFLQSVANVLASAIERRRGELAVIEGESRLQAILDNASDAIISSDGHGIIVFNRQAGRVFGYTPEEVLGKPIEMLMPDRFRRRHRDQVQAFTKGNVTQRLMGERSELFGRHKSGEEFPVEITISKVEVGGHTVLTSIIRDVTERIEAQSQLRDSERRFRNLFERSPIALWEEDFSAVGAWLDGLQERGIKDIRAHLRAHPDVLDHGIDLIRVLNVNPAGVQLVGADSVEQLLGAFPKDMRSESLQDAFINELGAISEGQESFELETIGTTFGGERIDCVLHYAAGRSDDRVDLSHVRSEEHTSELQSH